MDLRCRKTGCKYNKNLTCTAKSIEIGKKLNCNTFEKVHEDVDFSAEIFSENPPKISDYRHLKDVCLTCKADCLFNRSGNCIANGITINSPKKSPICITFART